MFPKITHLNDILPFIKDSPEIGIYPADNDTTVLCYAISDKNTFMGEYAEFKRECRGITFDREGRIICRPLHKFFNIGEKDETQPNVIPWEDIQRILIKHDGSMITPLLIDGVLHVKTKRSFKSLEAVRALEYLNKHPEKRDWVESALRNNRTPVFEWVSPESPIVLTHYKEPELILLQMRDIHTGEYLDLGDTPFRTAENKINDFVDHTGHPNWDLLKSAMLSNTNEEGWILQTTSGLFVKAKTDWYFSAHRTCTFLRWRDMLTSLRDGSLDDLRSAFSVSGRSSGVIDFAEEYFAEQFEKRVAEIKLFAGQIDAVIGEGLSHAEVAARWKKRPFFAQAMRMVRGTCHYDSIRKELFTELIPQWSLSTIPSDLLSDWRIGYHEAITLAVKEQ